MDGVLRQHVERSHHYAYWLHNPTSTRDWKIFFLLISLLFLIFLPKDLTMPWHFAGHLNSSHLGCHKIIRSSDHPILYLWHFKPVPSKNVKKHLATLGFAASLCHGMQVTCQILCVAPTSRASQAARTRLRASWVQWGCGDQVPGSCCTGSTVLLDTYVYVYIYIYLYTLGMLPASLPSMSQLRYCICSTLRCIRALEGGDW